MNIFNHCVNKKLSYSLISEIFEKVETISVVQILIHKDKNDIMYATFVSTKETAKKASVDLSFIKEYSNLKSVFVINHLEGITPSKEDLELSKNIRSKYKDAEVLIHCQGKVLDLTFIINNI